MKRVISLALSLAMSCSLLAGCSASSSGTDLSQIPSMTLDEVAGTRLVASTTEEMASEIYNYVTDRIVVDGSKLIEVSGKDEANINNLLTNINTQLQGKGGDVLTPEYANYLLLEFAKTPYEWKQSNKNIIGFDPAARLYFVDVTYTTISDNPKTATKELEQFKSVVPNSKIPNGHPDSEMLKQKRYMDYLQLLAMKYEGNDPTKYAEMSNKFKTAWGDIPTIFSEQQGVSLYERTLNKGTATGGIGKLTYSGLVSDETFRKVGATMTVRYVLKYALNLGEETDLSVEALYLKSYELDNYNEILSKYTLKDTASLEVLKPFIDQLILSYNKCVEESNHIGLYKLFQDYATLDKYYDEIRDYTYNSIGGYNYQILERKPNGKEVAVLVNRVNQIRARGAEMSLPTYEEKLVYNIILGQNDTIYLKDIYLLESKLIGEPLSVIRNVTGISDQIQYADVAFSDTNKKAVEKLIAAFSQAVTNNDYSSSAFLSCVDLGISQNTLNRMAETIKAITPTKMHTYIISWDTKTNVYCSVTVRQVFECENGNFDTEAVIDMGNRNGEWKVVNYTRTVNIKTEAGETDASNAICSTERSVVGGEITKIEGTTSNNVEVVKPVDRPEETPTPEVTPNVTDPAGSGEGETEGTEPTDTPVTPEPTPEVTPEVNQPSGSVDDFS